MLSTRTTSPDGAWAWDGTSWRATVPYASAARRARWAVWMLRLIIGLGTCGLIGWGLALIVPDQLAHYAPTPMNGLGALTALMIVLGLGFYLAFVPCAAAFILWFHRVYRNLPAIGMPRQHRTGWAAYVWFIPFVNFYLPLRTVQEAWDASHGRHPQQASFFSGVKVDPLLRMWWLFFFGPGLLERFASADFSTSTKVFSSSLWMFGITAAYIVGAVAAIRVVRELQLAQDLAAGVVLPPGSAQAPAAHVSSDPANAKDRFPNYL